MGVQMILIAKSLPHDDGPYEYHGRFYADAELLRWCVDAMMPDDDRRGLCSPVVDLPAA
jgi:hypothetical protein